jgi:PAS domain S-box-containing protein
MKSKTKPQLIEKLTELTVQQEKLSTEAQQQARELEVLLELGQAITANLGLDKVLETAYIGVGRLMPNEAFWIAAYQPGAEYYHYLIVVDRGERYPLTKRSLHHGVGGQVIRTGQPILLGDPTEQNLFPVQRFGSPESVKSVLCVPLLIGDRFVGVMSTQSYETEAYSEADLALLVRLAQPIAIALENAQLYQAVQQRAQDLGQANRKLEQEIARRELAEVALRQHQEHLEEQVAERTLSLSNANAELQREIAERVQAEAKRAVQERFLGLLNDITYTALKTSSLQDMLQILADRLGELIRADGCYITLWDEATQTIIPAAASGSLRHSYPSSRVEPDERTMTQAALEAGHALIIEDTFNTPYLSLRIAAQFPSRSVIALPLIVNTQKLGAALIAFNAPHHFTPAEIAYSEQAVQQIALAVSKAKLLKALQESEKRYHDLFEYATDAIFIETLDGAIVAVNEKACQLLGYTQEELLSLKVTDLIPPRPSSESFSIHSALRENEHLLFEGQNKRKDGSLVEVEVSMRLIGLEDQEIAQVFVRDITRRKQLEEQLQQLKRMEAISSLAGGIAHDFNNLLMIITGHCDFILNTPDLIDQVRRDVEKIEKAGQRAAALTGQLLAFSRQQRLFPRVTDLNKVVAKLEQSLKQMAGQEIELLTKLEPELGLVHIDPDQFEHVIINLVGNACEAMPEGGKVMVETANIYLAEADVTQQLDVQPGRYIRLTVTDTGRGMDQAIQAHLFEPFFTTKTVGKGVGLGLALVHGVVKQSEGHIQVRSEPDSGTTFSIFLPQI